MPQGKLTESSYAPDVLNHSLPVGWCSIKQARGGRCRSPSEFGRGRRHPSLELESLQMLLLTRSTSFHCLITTRIPETQSASPLRLAARQCAAALDGDCAQSQESRKVQSSSRAAKGFWWYTDVRTLESQGKSVKEFQGCIRFSTPGPQRAAMRNVALHSPQSCRTQYASHTSFPVHAHQQSMQRTNFKKPPRAGRPATQ